MLTDIKLNSPNRFPVNKARVCAVRARLSGDNTCTAEGITARSVLALCRTLIAAGVDPERPLEAYRGDTLCLRVRSIGEAAKFELNGKGTEFVRCPAAVGIAPPVARECRERLPGRKTSARGLPGAAS